MPIVPTPETLLCCRGSHNTVAFRTPINNNLISVIGKNPSTDLLPESFYSIRQFFLHCGIII